MNSMRFLFFLLIFVALPAPALTESNIPGWGKAQWGMTHSEIEKHYALKPWEADDIPTCRLKNRVRIWGHDFGVAFYFDERSDKGKLYKVVLVHFNNNTNDTAWLNSIKDLLVEKYGNPETFSVNAKMKISQWTKSDGQMKLTTLAENNVMCAIEYISLREADEKL
ncbi:MAG: hypothetical protein JSW26_20520 [Desulfobacterales bacterium]|nr:MAG: hypothetical protein JSW26_20520 [Desulfobacterales bacterium]